MTDQNYNLAKCEAGYAVYPLFELETHSAFLKLYNKMVKDIKLNQNKTLTSSIKYYKWKDLILLILVVLVYKLAANYHCAMNYYLY